MVAAAVAGIVALIAHPLPFGFGLMVGALAGLVAGGIVLARTAAPTSDIDDLAAMADPDEDPVEEAPHV